MSDDDDDYPRHRQGLDMSIVGTKGLLNPSGENNCFLNSAIQVLWHMDAFRQNFRLLSEHACVGQFCIFCGLKVIFTQFEFSDETSLPPLALRVALAETFREKQKFQLQNMDDAAECFENVLVMLHRHVAYGYSEDRCSRAHCITHQMFAMNIVEKWICSGCGYASKPSTYMELVHYVNIMNLIFQTSDDARSFGHQLQVAFNDAEGHRRTCPRNCGNEVEMVQSLLNMPSVVSIGLIWDTEQPSLQHVRAFVKCIDTTLQLNDLFPVGTDGRSTENIDLQLVGVVCYYGKHYSTFFFHSKRKTWISFDDACVSEIGVEWKKVTDKICRGRYQPLLLLYQREHPSLISTHTAPKQTIIVPNLSASQSSVQDMDISENSNNNSRSKPKHPCKPSSAPSIDRSAGLIQNSNNVCSNMCTSHGPAGGVRAMVENIESKHEASPCKPDITGWKGPSYLPSPLVPYSHSPSSSACSSSQQLASNQPVIAAAAMTGAHIKHLPVYNAPRPNAVPQPVGYTVPFGRPAGFQPGCNQRPAVCRPVGIARGGGAMFAGNANSSHQMPTPAGMSQFDMPSPGSQQNGLPHLQTYVSSGIISSPVGHISTGRNDVPLNSTSSMSVTSAGQPGTVSNRLSDICTSINGMALNDDFSLLQYAMNEERAAFDVGQNVSAGHRRVGSDSSLSDWSIIEMPSSDVTSVQHEATIVKETPVGSLTDSSLMHFSLDSELSNGSNSVSSGPLPARTNQFSTQKLSTVCMPQPGLSVSPVGGPCVESRRKADDMLMMCTLKEMSGDLHEALIFCNQAALCYKQCITTAESSSLNLPSAELDLLQQKYNEAVASSRRIHSLIQLKYEEDRMNKSKQSKNTPAVSPAPFSSAQTQCFSSPLSTGTAVSKNDNLIQLDESVPSVRQQALKEQLHDLYQQPVRMNAFRAGRGRPGSAAGIVSLLQQQGSAAGVSKSNERYHQ